jgi:hypothetical protein
MTASDMKRSEAMLRNENKQSISAPTLSLRLIMTVAPRAKRMATASVAVDSQAE